MPRYVAAYVKQVRVICHRGIKEEWMKKVGFYTEIPGYVVKDTSRWQMLFDDYNPEESFGVCFDGKFYLPVSDENKDVYAEQSVKIVTAFCANYAICNRIKNPTLDGFKEPVTRIYYCHYKKLSAHLSLDLFLQLIGGLDFVVARHLSTAPMPRRGVAGTTTAARARGTTSAATTALTLATSTAPTAPARKVGMKSAPLTVRARRAAVGTTALTACSKASSYHRWHDSSSCGRNDECRSHCYYSNASSSHNALVSYLKYWLSPLRKLATRLGVFEQ
jgi:hypothetical protein